MGSPCRISVIIPVYNGGIPFIQCLRALHALKPAAYEYIVVADGDQTGAAEHARAFGAKVIELPVRSGPAHARNVGAALATGDILFFVDADVVVNPDALAQIDSAFQDPDLTAVLGSYDDDPAEPGFLSQYRNLLHHYVHQIGREEASTFWGACGAIRRKAFIELGGFDERYREPCIEDIELGYRLKRGGHRIRLVKTLQVKHLKRWGVRTMIKTDFFQRALPWTALILRDGQMVNDLNLGVSARWSVVAVFAIATSLLFVPWHPEFLIVTAIAAICLLVLNRWLYRFFLRKRGLWFVARVLPWHWLYFLYSGLAFAIGFALYILGIWRFEEALPAKAQYSDGGKESPR